MSDRTPGVIGKNPKVSTDWPPGSGFAEPGPGGTDPIALTQRLIAKVEDDWHPPAPDASPTIVLHGKTLAEVAKELDRLDEWGQGGGMLRSEPIPAGNSSDLTVKLHGHLRRRLPSWPGYAAASAASKQEWDQMIAKLTIHEQRHMDIAIQHGDDLAAALLGQDISVIAKLVTEANRQMAADQQQLDQDTANGSKPGVQYGDVSLDTSIT